MTSKRGYKLKKRAKKAREAGSFDTSANRFTQAAYEALGESAYSENRTLTSGTTLGDAIYYLQSAAIDFRKADQHARCENRCQLGILVLQDVRQHASERSAIDGVCTEMIGDFRYIGELPDANRAYERARSYYTSVDSPEGWQSEPIFESAFQCLLELGEYVEEPISVSTQLSVYDSFDDRIDLKRDHYPELLAALD